MQANLRARLAEIPGSSGADRIALGRRIVAYGEPAVPVLVEALDDPDAEIRGMAAWMLGFVGDPRAANALARHARDADRLVAYEAASALLRMDDVRGLRPLVGGLEDPDPTVRARCLVVLQERTGETFGFQPDGRPEDRGAAVARWQAFVVAQERARR
jgi:HEAT repeat protein